jgi:hypothetical protein
MNRAEPADAGPNGPGGAANPTALEPHSGQSDRDTCRVSSRSGNRGCAGRKGRDYTRVSFYDRLKWLPPREQVLRLMYGEEGPGSPAQQVAAQIRTLKNLLARFPNLQSSATAFSIRGQIERKMAQLSSQERAEIRAWQMKGSPKLPRWSDRTIAALLLVHQAKAGPVNLSQFHRNQNGYRIAEPLPDGSHPENKKRYTERNLAFDLRTLRKIAHAMGVPVLGPGRPRKPAI